MKLQARVLSAWLRDYRSVINLLRCVQYRNLVLQVNHKLLWIGLGSNSIGSEGTWALCESLRQNTSLLWLGLGGNELSDRGALHLATLLQSNYTL